MSTLPYPSSPVLVVDDETPILSLFESALHAQGITNVLAISDSRQVMPLFEEKDVEVVLLDLAMPHVGGAEILDALSTDYPDVPVIVVTGLNDVQEAVHCMKRGAFDYMVKPVEESRLCSSVKRAIELRELRRENSALKGQVLGEGLQSPQAFADIVTANAKLQAVLHYAEAVAGSSFPVLITGETGTGKELVARALHRASGRPGAFIAVNVAGLDDNLFSDALFGHAKGAFTGADTVKRGLVDQASGGTLFLDEIGELGVASQVKLLRLLQEKEYFPLGANVPRRTDTRVVVATNRNAEELEHSGRLRKDLYYRLKTHHIHLPPLRERRDDLPLLLDHFLGTAAAALGKRRPTPPVGLVDLLRAHDFPGNVRELEAMVNDAVSRHTSKTLSMEVFKARIKPRGLPDTPAKAPMLAPFATPDGFPTLKQAAEFLVSEAMRLANGNQSIAARFLGISPPALNRRLKQRREDGNSRKPS